MFEKILIANRGEIACRVIRTEANGIATVAVYSDADRDALHVSMADESVRIAPAPSSESYLRVEEIIGACRGRGRRRCTRDTAFCPRTQHFLPGLRQRHHIHRPLQESDRGHGGQDCVEGARPKRGVSTVPGFNHVIADADEAIRCAREIGYPVMLKAASAGGGGKGMRIAHSDDECREGFQRASSEARSSFADDRIFVEKFISQPRHIEIQILADQFDHIIHLNERECSIQRRHQKVLEEAPSSFVDANLQKAMGQQAIDLARAVNYVSAGTVEFIVDADRNFYFLEMNTRL